MSDGDVEKRVAGAIYKVAIQSALKHMEDYDFQLDRLRRVFGIIDIESDRSLAILIFALSEDLMLVSLKHYMIGKVKGGWEEVASGNGVLATANDRITILELLAWIRPEIAKHLRLMKSIRNRFAHHADVNGFEDGKIRGWLSSMDHIEVPVLRAMEESEAEPLKTPRALFIMRSVLTITALVSDLAIRPAAIAAKVWSGDISGSYDDGPEPLRDLRRIAAETIIRTCFSKKNNLGSVS